MANAGKLERIAQVFISILGVGVLSAGVSGFLSLEITKMELRDARSEKRIDQQREDLRDLQDLLAKELGSVDSLVRDKDECNETSPDKGWIQCGDDQEYTTAATKVKVLHVRPHDDLVRSLAAEVDRLLNGAVRATNKQEAVSLLDRAVKKYGEANERIGIVLRTQYSRIGS